MKEVENQIYILNSVNYIEEGSRIELRMDSNDSFAREVKEEDYKKLILRLYGVEDLKAVFQKLKDFEKEYIDFEELEKNEIDFWSEAHQIIIAKVNTYEIVVEEYQVPDWIERYKHLSKIYYDRADKNTKKRVLESTFLDNLKFVINKEISNSETKISFLDKQDRNVSDIEKKVVFAKRVLNLVKRYEQKKNENE